MQIAIAYVAAILQMLVVFHKPIGIPDVAADVLQIISLACWIIFFVLWKRQKTAVASPASPKQSK